MAAKRRARRPKSDDSTEVGRKSGSEGSDDDEESGKSGETAIPAEERSPPLPEDAGFQRSGEASPPRGGVTLKTKTTPSKRVKKPRPAEDASPARVPPPDDSAGAGHHYNKRAKSGEDAIPSPLKRAEQRSPPSPEDAGPQGSGEVSPARGGVTSKTKTTSSKRLKKSPPASPARGGPLTDGSAAAGHNNKRAATPNLGEKRSPPPLQAEERPEKRAAGPDADTVAASAPKPKKKKSKKKKKKQLRKALAEPPPPPPPPPQKDEHHGWEMAEREPSKTSPPQDERRAREEEAQEKKTAEQDKGTHTASLAPPSPRLNLRSDPEPTGFWGVEVKPGEPYAHEFSGCVRITQATLGNLMSVGRTIVTCSLGRKEPVRLCALDSALATYRLELEYGEGQNVVFSVIGDSSVHLAGYKICDGAANVQALVTQIQEADHETTHVHGTAQKHNALDTGVHNDVTNEVVGQAGLNAAAKVQALVTQSQEAADHKTTHAHDIAWGRNALETEVHTDCANQLVGQPDLNIMNSDEASLGFGNRPVDKEDVGGPFRDELQIVELESGDCNAEMASDGKEVEVEYIGMLKDGEVIDSFEGRPAVHTFTIGVDDVIAGWHRGIRGMRVGEKRKLTIPPALGYKDIPQKMIPANSWLVYEIKLLRVSEPGEEKPKRKSRSVSRH